jgi:Na+-translocating ferredoxin:NAD+ oxidoreductase RnfD subunit
LSAAPPTNTVALSRGDVPELRAAPRVALRSNVGLARFFGTFATGAAFPAFTGLLLFGWRALATLLVVLPVTVASFYVWRRIGRRGRQLHLSHALWFATLLWLMLPAHLLSPRGPGQPFDPWPVPAVASVALVILMWLLGGVGSGRIHPVLVTYLLLVVCFDPLLAPTAVLQRHRTLTGDLTRALPPTRGDYAYMKDGYLKTPHVENADALHLEPAAKRLLAFTSGRERPTRSWLSLESLLRDEMPPLEDLIIGGQPGPIGGTCAVSVIIGGLFLLYRGVIDFRVPLCVLAGAFAALVSLPIPVVIKEAAAPAATVSAERGGPQWRWFVFREHYREPRVADVGWAEAVTFANYEIMSGPLLLTTFFFATAPALRPMSRRARIIYGLLVGVLAAGFQLYLSIGYGPYLALLIVSLLTPLLDKTFRARTLV